MWHPDYHFVYINSFFDYEEISIELESSVSVTLLLKLNLIAQNYILKLFVR